VIPCHHLKPFLNSVVWMPFIPAPSTLRMKVATNARVALVLDWILHWPATGPLCRYFTESII